MHFLNNFEIHIFDQKLNSFKYFNIKDSLEGQTTDIFPSFKIR